jgi:hypothetical protein
VYSPERVAAAIVRCAEHPRRLVVVGAAPCVLTMLWHLAPSLYERLQPKFIGQDHLGEAAADASMGNMLEPREPHARSGGWKEWRERKDEPHSTGGAPLDPLSQPH